MSIDRREFVRNAAGALAAAAIMPNDRTRPQGLAPAPDRLDRLGVQLYTVRDLMQESVERTIAQVAEAGFKEVEFAGYFGRTPAQLAAVLRENGLTSPSTHIGLPELRSEDWARTVDLAAQVGHQWLILAWIAPADRATVDRCKAIADALQTAADVARQSNIRVGFHNHDGELAPIEGTTALDVMIERTQGTDVAFEMDLYWTVRAGADPLAYFARYPGRFPLVHVKDSGGAPNHVMRDVGKGTIDFARIFAQRAHAGIQHFYVEHDEPGDALASIRTSAAYLRTLTF